METLLMQDLANACLIFMRLSYPDGLESIPDVKRPYFAMTGASARADFLPPGPFAVGICQDLSKLPGGVKGYEFRLGSAAHPHLKMRAQLVEYQQREVWVFSVDTHDRVFMKAVKHLGPEQAAAWRLLVEKNGALKQQIEDAFAAAGLITPTGLLKLDLTKP